MLTIRSEQMVAFEHAMHASFEERAAARLGRVFPAASAELGRDGVVALVRHGVARARRYGVTAERDVWLYLCVMVVLGREFDVDPDLEWATGILADRDVPGGMRMEFLWSDTRQRAAEPKPPERP
jgi:hypothetical protein